MRPALVKFADHRIRLRIGRLERSTHPLAGEQRTFLTSLFVGRDPSWVLSPLAEARVEDEAYRLERTLQTVRLTLATHLQTAAQLEFLRSLLGPQLASDSSDAPHTLHGSTSRTLPAANSRSGTRGSPAEPVL